MTLKSLTLNALWRASHAVS